MIRKAVKKIYSRVEGALFGRFPFLLSLRPPRTLVIEPTNMCMLKCRVCATVNAPARPMGKMSLELFGRIMGQLDWPVKRINFSFAGEPLLNRDIFKMVEMARKKGIPSIIETNGMLLEESVDRILDSGLFKLMVAFDGISQESAAKYRQGLDFARVLSGIKALAAKKAQRGRKAPQIHLLFIVMKHNEHEMEKAVRLGRDLGADFINFKSMILSGGLWLNEAERNRFADEFLPQSEKFRRYRISGGNWVLKKNLERSCPHVFSEFVIMWNGDVTVCTMDTNGKFVVGNVEKNPLRQIWKDSRYTGLKTEILKKGLAECRECGYLVDHYTCVRLK